MYGATPNSLVANQINVFEIWYFAQGEGVPAAPVTLFVIAFGFTS